MSNLKLCLFYVRQSKKFDHVHRNYSAKAKFPKPLDDGKDLPIFQYPLAKSSDRRIYVWGQADTGALGLRVPETNPNAKKLNSVPYCLSPKRLSFAEYHTVTHLTAGYGFSAYAIKTKDREKVFGTGINTDSQIGFHDPRRSNPLEILSAPAPLRLPLKHPEATKILSMSAGRAHLVVATEEGVFTSGNNAYGQCGRRIIENEDYQRTSILHHIKELGGEKIIDVQCGQDHSMFITPSGKVFACGWGADGQLGRGSFKTDQQQERVTGDILNEKIIKLSCAADCVLALSEKGEVFGWGNTEYGQLSSNANKECQVNVPRFISSSKGLGKIIDIAAGGSFCCVLNENGDVFSWGFGLLGQGPDAQHSQKPVQIPSTLFGRNEFNPNSVVSKINSGMSHMVAITDSGDLYSWGRNKFGCLGLGHMKDQYFPIKLAIGATVVKVACGIDHTIALCKPFL